MCAAANAKGKGGNRDALGRRRSGQSQVVPCRGGSDGLPDSVQWRGGSQREVGTAESGNKRRREQGVGVGRSVRRWWSFPGPSSFLRDVTSRFRN